MKPNKLFDKNNLFSFIKVLQLFHCNIKYVHNEKN